MSFKILYILILIKVCSADSKEDANTHIYNVALNTDNTIQLNWELDYPSKCVCFEIHIKTKLVWFAFGFSDRGEPYPADYCILSKTNNKWHLEDVWADETGVLHYDNEKQCDDFKINEYKNVLKFTFRRKFDTCDKHDYIIEDGTTHIVWAKGLDTIYKVQGMNISSNKEDSGMVRVQLLKNIFTKSTDLSSAKILEIQSDKVEVPNEETTYWCHVHKLPDYLIKKHHILQYEPLIQPGNEGIVHHMEVFRCIADHDEEIPSYRGSCFAENRPAKTQVCKRVMAAWAMGAKGFTYPEQAGLPIGGKEYNKYIMLEVHYNNPTKKAGFIDSSGVKFYITDQLRQMDAGIIELGLEYTDKMVIPPLQESFPLSGYCISECTAVSLPTQGITIFGSQLHTHLTGIRVFTRHFRNGIELPELNRDDHYSTHFQEIRRLKRSVNVLPGDALITTCDYQTINKNKITLGGFAITDEMCVNYVHYYPATPLEVCKSAISDQALATFFQYMKDWEDQPTSPSQPISENYANIHWNKMRVQLLREVYNEAPLSMQCNMSSGDRFPGYWENSPVTSVRLPLPPPARNCNNKDIIEDDYNKPTSMDNIQN